IMLFLQAEDGIRAFHVTGVQTCALPISEHHKAQDSGQISLFGEATGVDYSASDSILNHLNNIEPADKRKMLRWEKELVGLYVTRSEERRVGKACRAGCAEAR